VDIRGIAGLLHLKSGAAYLGNGRMALVGALGKERAFAGFETIPIPEGEEYAANCVLVNERVLLAAGYRRTEGLLRRLGYSVLTLDVSEFRKMDGGLSCLSLRF
jgi:dimethylargininase